MRLDQLLNQAYSLFLKWKHWYSANRLPWLLNEIIHVLEHVQPAFPLPPPSKSEKQWILLLPWGKEEADRNIPTVEMRKPRRTGGSSRSERVQGQSPAIRALLKHGCCDRWLVRVQTKAPPMHWGEQRAYSKHLGWGFATGFSIWPGFQAIKLNWNICSLTNCCFNNKPMFVLLSTEKTLHIWPRASPLEGSIVKPLKGEMVKRSSTLIPSTMRGTTLTKRMRSQTVWRAAKCTRGPVNFP